MGYRAPVSDILFTMRHAGGLDEGVRTGIYADLSLDLAHSTLVEAAKFAENVLSPLNRVGDKVGATWKDGAVTTPPGWTDAYAQFAAGGWQAMTGAHEYGGMGLPQLLMAGCHDMWCGANFAFMLLPPLTFGAIDALEAHATDEIKNVFLANMNSGVWPATMALTEPGAGSDLNPLRTRAERGDDGEYLITGQKIYITYGEHDLAENIVHLVLARLTDAPAGTKGISLFVVPKYLVNADGTVGAHNDVRCAGIESKLGVRGSPTCTMIFGDQGGAVGYLVGEENKGLACMFTMMNAARLITGLHGIAVGEAAYQHALAHAHERRQGRAPGAEQGLSAIIDHPDVSRMLMTMKALTHAGRALCYLTAGVVDRARRTNDAEARALYEARASLLTPIAKAYGGSIGFEVASLGVQVFGGSGYIEDTGAAHYLRDTRIIPIFEGTNGIQAIDLVTRKLPRDDGAAMRAEIADMRATAASVTQTRDPAFGATGARLAEAINALQRASDALTDTTRFTQNETLAVASPYLDLFSIVRAGASLVEVALAAREARTAGDGDRAHAARISVARFYAENILVTAGVLEAMILSTSDSVLASRFVLEV